MRYKNIKNGLTLIILSTLISLVATFIPIFSNANLNNIFMYISFASFALSIIGLLLCMFDKEIRFTLAGIIYLISLGIYIAGVIMNFNNNPQAKWLEMTYIVLCFLFTIFICFGCKKITKKINKRTTLPTFVFVLLIITYSIAIGLGFWNATDLLSATFKTIISVLFYVITLVANLLFFLLLCNTRYKLKM